MNERLTTELLTCGQEPCGSDEVRLYLGNLRCPVTGEKVRKMFSQIGVTPLRVEVPRHGHSHGYAFADCESQDGQRVSDSLNGQTIDGRKLRVEVAHRSRRSRSTGKKVSFAQSTSGAVAQTVPLAATPAT
jgi:RNA recognition motif-containing protein